MSAETQPMRTETEADRSPQEEQRREALRDAIAEQQALIARLDREQADARLRLDALRSDLSSLGSRSLSDDQLPPKAQASDDGCLALSLVAATSCRPTG